MSTLEYQTPRRKDPRIQPATTHLLLWAVFNSIVATISASIFVFLFLPLIWHLVFTKWRDNAQNVLMLVGVQVIALIVFLVFWVFAVNCRRFRVQIRALHPGAAERAARWASAALLPAAVPLGLALLLTLAQLINGDSVDPLITLVFLFFAAIPVYPVLWTRNVLRRAHQAAVDARRIPPV